MCRRPHYPPQRVATYLLGFIDSLHISNMASLDIVVVADSVAMAHKFNLYWFSIAKFCPSRSLWFVRWHNDARSGTFVAAQSKPTIGGRIGLSYGQPLARIGNKLWKEKNTRRTSALSPQDNLEEQGGRLRVSPSTPNSSVRVTIRSCIWYPNTMDKKSVYEICLSEVVFPKTL